MRFQSYFNTAITIIQAYDGNIPLHHFLKQYFSANKKHGSRDRKFITQACYCYYRPGKLLVALPVEERLRIAILICTNNIADWSFLFTDVWLQASHNMLHEKIQFIQSVYDVPVLQDVFPYTDELSDGIDATAFIQSFFIQPDVFIRTRPGYHNAVINKLQQHAIDFRESGNGSIALPPSVRIDSLIKVNREAVIQDFSSQRIAALLKQVKLSGERIKAWDCCAGSGGKSILLYDVLSNADLTVSDVRASIIQNLKQRFAEAGIHNHKSFVADITNSEFKVPGSGFDLIICDAPCTGSGTWSRTPEQLYFFSPEKIDAYVLLQQQIVANAFTQLKNNGWFLYITCSVFKKENEGIVQFIQKKFHPELMRMELLTGYHNKADTMFAALFKKQHNSE